MESLLIWGLILISAAVLILIVEIFVPSSGALSVLSIITAVVGLVCLFRYDVTWGLCGLLGLLVLAPTLVAFGLKIWPSTPIGRRIIGVPTEEQLEQKRLAEEEEKKRWLALIGRDAQVVVDLRPIGVVEIDGKRYDAIADTKFVKAGGRVRVITVEGAELRVRAL